MIPARPCVPSSGSSPRRTRDDRMASILDTIADHARQRVRQAAEEVPLDALKALCRDAGRADGKRFLAALKKPGVSFICEVKKASPSKGVISPDFPYRQIAEDYERAGADCISCLTEPKWFLGSDDIFREIRAAVKTPMLRKDFVVDEYQLYEAGLMGADAVLLICGILGTETLARYLEICDALGLAALVEAHDKAEIASAVSVGAEMIGVNNRDLKDFSVDFTNARRLRDSVPPGKVYVAESGVRRPEDAAAVKAAGADAALVGEMLMRAPDKGAALAALREAAK